MGRAFVLVSRTYIHMHASHRFVRPRSLARRLARLWLSIDRLIMACFEQVRYVCVVRVRVDFSCCGSEPSGEGDVRAGACHGAWRFGALAVTVSTVSQVGSWMDVQPATYCTVPQ